MNGRRPTPRSRGEEPAAPTHQHADSDGTRPKNEDQENAQRNATAISLSQADTSVNGVRFRFGDSHGRIKRSEGAKDSFKRLHPCPATGRASGPCPGYVIDNIVPLCASGPDAAYNMQWQATAQSKEKDRWERTQCNAFPKR